MFTSDPVVEFHFNQNCDNTGTGTNTITNCTLENYEVWEGYSGDTRGHYNLTGGNLDLTQNISDSTLSIWIKLKDDSNIVLFESLNTNNYPLSKVEYNHIVVTAEGAVYINKILYSSITLNTFNTIVSGNCYLKEFYAFNYELAYKEILNLYIKDYKDPLHWFPIDGDYKDYGYKLSGELIQYGDPITLTADGAEMDIEGLSELRLPSPPLSWGDNNLTVTLRYKNYQPTQTMLSNDWDDLFLLAESYYDSYYGSYGSQGYCVSERHDERLLYIATSGGEYGGAQVFNTLGQKYWIVIQRSYNLIKVFVDGVLKATANDWIDNYQNPYYFRSIGNITYKANQAGDMGKAGTYADIRVYRGLINPDELITLNELIEFKLPAKSFCKAISNYTSIEEQVQELYDTFLALQPPTSIPPEGITDPDYLEAQDILPLFTGKEVYFD